MKKQPLSRSKHTPRAQRAHEPQPQHSRGAAPPDAPFYLSRCIGLDLGDKAHHFCVISAAGAVQERGTLPNTKAALTHFATRWQGTRIVLECGAQSSWISHHLNDANANLEVIVANPRKVESISKNTRKSDPRDAEALARLGRADIELLHPITHRGLEAQRHLALIRMRDTLVRHRVGLVNCLRGLLKSTGEEVPSADPGSFVKKCRAQFQDDVLTLIDPMLAVLDRCSAEVKTLEKKIERLIAEEYPDAARLQQIDGVGPITALSFVLTIDDAKRFSQTRDIGAFLGLIPRRDQSGIRDKALPITKCGDRFLRRLLVNCAQYILGPFAQPSDLRTHGLEMIQRFGPLSRKRVVISIARKLAVLMLSMCKNSTDWQPHRNPAPPPTTPTTIAA